MKLEDLILNKEYVITAGWCQRQWPDDTTESSLRWWNASHTVIKPFNIITHQLGVWEIQFRVLDESHWREYNWIGKLYLYDSQIINFPKFLIFHQDNRDEIVETIMEISKLNIFEISKKSKKLYSKLEKIRDNFHKELEQQESLIKESIKNDELLYHDDVLYVKEVKSL